VIALLKEMILIRVIELYADFSISCLLAKEGASIRSNFLIYEAVTSHKELRVCVRFSKVVFDILFDIRIGLFALKSLDSNHRNDHIIFYQEVSKCLKSNPRLSFFVINSLLTPVN
jgi:hypothetical protein